MSEELYIDRIGDVVITGMVIRFNLMAIDPTQRDDNNQPLSTVRQRVVMPIDGFLRAAQTLSGTLPKLEEIGVIRKNQKPESAAAVDPAEVTKKVLDSVLEVSPNDDGIPTLPK